MISNAGHDENGKISGGQDGDQTGQEWTIKAWYSRPWDRVLYFPDPAVSGLIAQLAKEAANNNKIGYNQARRRTFWQQLKSVGYFPSAITRACAADCSSGVAGIVKATGYILGMPNLQAVSEDMYTGNEEQVLTNAGFKVLTDSKYLTSDEYLKPGYILLYTGHHTAINLDWGSKAERYDMDVEQYLNSVKNFHLIAKNGNYAYGDSHALPPCSDHVTSCDRGDSARPLWDLGFNDQPVGGITVLNMEQYLLKWGFHKVTNQNALKRGDIVLMRDKNTSPNPAWHTFVLTDFKNVNDISKYDFGSAPRIRSNQPFKHVKLNEWEGSRWFYCAFRWGEQVEELYVNPDVLKYNTKSSWAYNATEILKARNFKGVLDKTKNQRKDLQLNSQWTIGDMAAMADYKLQRTINGTNLAKGPYGAGEVGPDDWADMFGGPLPFRLYEIPKQQSTGTCVLFLQEKMVARGITDNEGNKIALDQVYGEKTKQAFMKYQKARGEKNPDGIVTVKWWKDLCGIG